MLSKAKIKFIKALSLKKNRDADSLFIAEGDKIVSELLEEFDAVSVAATNEWSIGKILPENVELIKVDSADELKAISSLKTPPSVVGIFRQYQSELSAVDTTKNLVLVLDTIQDPGNLGTIIRIADWFGITDIVCSKETADIYNPKVIQSTMGAIGRVRVYYTDLAEWLSKQTKVPIYATSLHGENIYQTKLSSTGIIIMGNEGKGVSDKVMGMASKLLLIPSFNTGPTHSESLNVGVATGIVCSEFRRC